jgi:hypothetical protein
MRAWVSCFGKPLLCAIESGDVLGATVHAPNDAEGVPLCEVQRFPRNVVVGAGPPRHDPKRPTDEEE